MSGPLLDRIDLHVDVPAVTWGELTARRRGEPSARVRERVEGARERAARRLGGRTNAEMRLEEVGGACRPDREGRALLREAVERFGLSARGYHRVLRVARTVADLAGEEAIGADAVAEAIPVSGAGREGAPRVSQGVTVYCIQSAADARPPPAHPPEIRL